MIELDTDKQKQLLTIRFAQTVTVQETEAAVPRIQGCMDELLSGFHVFTDFCGLEHMEVACAPSISKIMDICAAKGVSSIYRLMPDPTKDIGFNILSHFHYTRKVHIVTLETRKEADDAMENLG